MSVSDSVTRGEAALPELTVDSPPTATLSGESGMTLAQIGMLAVPLVAIGALYWNTFVRLIEVWDKDPNYSHGFVVPFFAIGLCWIAFQRTGALPVSDQVDRRSLMIGGIEIAFGFVLHIVALFFGKIGLFFDVAALIFMLRGTVLALGGPTAHAAYGFPLLFLIFMAPIPAPVYDPIALRMQSIASIVATGMLDFVGVPVLREGYVIQIPGHLMRVEGACSGMRSLTLILALALAIGYLSGRGQGFRWALGLLAAPVAIGMNCVRVFGTGLIMLNFGEQWATGTAHEMEGLVTAGVAALLLVGVAWLLGLVEDTYFKTPSESQAIPPTAAVAGSSST